MYIWNTDRLAQDLAHDRITEREKAYYLLSGWLVYAVISYSTVTFSNAGRTLLGLIEFILVILITIFGIKRSYENLGGDNSRTFIVDFTCLLLPITIKVNILVWGLYWLAYFGFRMLVPYMSFASQASANAFILFYQQTLPWLMTLIAIVTTQLVLLIRIATHLKVVAELRQSSISSLQVGGPQAGAAELAR